MFWKEAFRQVKGDGHLVVASFCQEISGSNKITHSSKRDRTFQAKIWIQGCTKKPLQIYMTNYGKEMTVALLQQSRGSSMKYFFC